VRPKNSNVIGKGKVLDSENNHHELINRGNTHMHEHAHV